MSASVPDDVDVAATLDTLIDEGVVDEADDETLSLSLDFESVRGVYYDSYSDADDETFHQAVADVFDVPTDDAAAYVAENDVSREEFVTFLSLQSFFDETPDRMTLAVMASLVMDVTPETPVPPEVSELSDDDYEAFLDDHPDAVVTVWRRYCEPCLEMKADVDELLALVPDGVAVAGIDGEAAPGFRLEHGVDTAPAVVLFSDGERARVETGRATPAAFEAFLDDVYGSTDD